MDDIRDIDSMSGLLGALSSNASLLHKLLLLICLPQTLSTSVLLANQTCTVYPDQVRVGG